MLAELQVDQNFFTAHKKRPETSSVLFLAVVRTSRHPQSASLLHKVAQFRLLWNLAIHASSNLVDYSIATPVYRRKCLNTKKSKYI